MHLRRVLTFAALFALILAAGCQSTPEAPANTGRNPADNLRLVADGRNTELKFKADHLGSIVVTNFSNGDTVYRGTLKAGDVFVLTPNSNRALINKETVYLDHETNSRDEFRVYFLDR